MSNQYIIFTAFCACMCRAFGAMVNNLGGDTNRNTKKINLKEMKISNSGRCPFSMDELSATTQQCDGEAHLMQLPDLQISVANGFFFSLLLCWPTGTGMDGWMWGLGI